MQIAIVFRKRAMVSVIWIFFNMLAQSDCDAWTYSMTIKDETHQLDINECISVYDQIQAKIAKKKTKPKPKEVKPKAWFQGKVACTSKNRTHKLNA